MDTKDTLFTLISFMWWCWQTWNQITFLDRHFPRQKCTFWYKTQYTQSFGEAVSSKSCLQITQIRGFKEAISNCIFNIEQIEHFDTAIFFVQKYSQIAGYIIPFFFSFNSHSSPISFNNLYFVEFRPIYQFRAILKRTYLFMF